MTLYLKDSQQAMLRLLALAVTSNGVPVDSEVTMLEKRGVLRGLGLGRADLDAALAALCADLRATEPLAIQGFSKLSRKEVIQLLDEIRDPAKQRQIAQLLFDIFSMDHRMVRAESILLWEALDHWQLHLREVTAHVYGRGDAVAERRPLQASGGGN